jgi:hypothetical protein
MLPMFMRSLKKALFLRGKHLHEFDTLKLINDIVSEGTFRVKEIHFLWLYVSYEVY